MPGPERAKALPPFREPVGRIGVRELPSHLSGAAAELERRFPGLAFVLVVMDWGDKGGAAHISNCERASAVGTLREYCDETERRAKGTPR